MLKKILIITTVVLLMGATVSFLLLQNANENVEQMFIEAEQSVAAKAEQMREMFNHAVTSKATVVYVYDTNDVLLFRFNDPSVMTGVTGVQETLVDMIYKAEGINRKASFDYDQWKESYLFPNSVLGERVSLSGTLLYTVVAQMCTALEYQPNDFERAALMREFSDLTEEQMISYICATSTFGNASGLVGAADQLFSKSVEELNSNQARYIGYAYKNPNASFEDYCRLYGDYTNGASTAAEFGLYRTVNDSLWLVRQEVREELSTLLSGNLFAQTLHVKTSIDKRLQLELQESLDGGMRYSVSLSSVGNPTVNGTVCAVDARTGMYMALIAGRTIGQTAEVVTAVGTSPIGKYQALYAIFAGTPDCTAFTLLKFEEETGEEAFSPLLSFLEGDRLSLIGVSPTCKDVVALEESAQFFNSLHTDTKLRFVSQIKDENDNLLYTAKPATNISGEGNSPDLRVFLADGDPKAYSYHMDEQAANYRLQASGTSEIIVCSLFATTAAGAVLTEQDMYTVGLVHENFFGITGEYRPRYPELLDRDGKIADKLAATRQSNLGIIQSIAEGMLAKIDEYPIVSVSTRIAFEVFYANCEQTLNSYRGLIAEDVMNSLLLSLEEHRALRTADIMQYIT